MIKHLAILLFIPFFSYADISEKNLINLYREVKCLVCAGQSIAESNADHAIILREFIKEKAANGASETEIKKYLVDKFGPEVLFSPPQENFYKLLWAFPYLLLAGIIILIYFKKPFFKKKNL
jgi:cytochrome c-type biogenesis protein CcmH